MNDLHDGGYSDNQLISIEGHIFVCNISAEWRDGKYISKKDFDDEAMKALRSHHAETIKDRINGVGGKK